MTMYSDAGVVEVTAHLGVMWWSSHPPVPPHVMDITLMINDVSKLFYIGKYQGNLATYIVHFKLQMDGGTYPYIARLIMLFMC